MLVYPQLPSGALAQLPVQKRHRRRTLVNTAADGSVVKLGDAGAATIEWQLRYAGLSDSELSALLQFVGDAEGTLKGFTFVDPTANLLAWSNDLKNEVWDAAPFLTLTGAIAGPTGGNNAWHAAKSGAAAQSLSQTLTAPGAYTYCLSVYAKASSASTLTMLIGGSRHNVTLGSGWQRFVCSGSGDATAASVTFGIELGAGAAVDVYGLQVEPQLSASVYKASTTGGCYENARLGDDIFSYTTTDVNRHSATVHILYASTL